ncbi:hypothetical protein PoB_004656500 [Plakobranchus ocellatus]|uniref:Uncharacterized protein n=1 Tax=Plakobranchus ocellatus TaxID=259542 RepID=A0AAV4BKQ0_9GAST|nr:hypothetical protein PoB_004656500 [Plakobranchus ocellatus]
MAGHGPATERSYEWKSSDMHNSQRHRYHCFRRKFAPITGAQHDETQTARDRQVVDKSSSKYHGFESQGTRYKPMWSHCVVRTESQKRCLIVKMWAYVLMLRATEHLSSSSWPSIKDERSYTDPCKI